MGSSRKTVSLVFLFFASILFILTSNAMAEDFDYTEYEDILKKYVRNQVNIDGFTVNAVDYAGLYEESQKADSGYSVLLKRLSSFDPSSIEGRSDLIAFWINVYNIGAMKMIIDHYPVDSIRSSRIDLFRNPWDNKIIVVGGRKYSLGEIEHDILLGELNELMSHYGIVCASLSCPEIVQEVYSGDKLDQQLSRQARIFLSDPQKGLFIDREKNTVHVSAIYKFDKKNFKRDKDIIIAFILPFITDKEDKDYLRSKEYSLEFLDYNWDLNSAGKGKG